MTSHNRMNSVVVSSLVLGASVLAYFFVKHAGLTTKIVPILAPFPKKKCAYYTYIGDYPKAWKDYQSIFIKHLDTLFGRNDMINQPSFGIYYDDPAKVPVNERRCIIGVFLPDDLEFKDNEMGIKFGVIEEMKEAVQYKYPFYDMISIIFALKRILPQMQKYIKEQPGNWSDFMEVYGMEYYVMACLSGKDVESGLLSQFPE